jgi:hypothetical protein
MALSERKILDIMISKFNEEYVAHHKSEDFLITSIASGTDHSYCFEARSSFMSTGITKFRVYFNIGPLDNLPRFKLSPIDDAIPGEEYAFVTKGTLCKESALVDNATTTDTTENYDGDGVIDPTSVCVDVSMQLGMNEW